MTGFQLTEEIISQLLSTDSQREEDPRAPRMLIFNGGGAGGPTSELAGGQPECPIPQVTVCV